MKLTSQQMEEFYPIFKKIAYFSFRRVYSHLTDYEAETLAHDYTVQFFYSKSLAETFDENKSKGLKAYFSSYVSKCLIGYSREVIRERSVLSLEPYMEGRRDKHMGSLEAVDFKNYLESLYHLLDRVYITVKGEPLPCRVVLKAVVVQMLDKQLWGGEVSRRKIQDRLSLNDKSAKKALDKLKEVLSEKRAEGLI